MDRTGHLGRTRRNTRRYIQSQQLGILAENSTTLSIESVGTMIIITSIGDYEREQETIHDRLGWILPEVNATGDLEQIFVTDLRNQTAKMLSDGSYTKGRSSAAFVVVGPTTTTTLANTDLKSYLHGETTIPGNKKDHSSYRGELGGILAGVVYTNELCKKHQVMTGKCICGCDNIGALSATTKPAMGKLQPCLHDTIPH